jgi:hypothetical protein
MEVYLIPIGAREHELYCEVPDDTPDDGAPHDPGMFRRMANRFREMLAAAERERRDRLAGRPVETPQGWMGRLKARTLRWAAETIAEQRLLWHLRGCASATLVFPDDITTTEADATLRTQLARDYDKHRRWLVVNLLGLLASAPLMFVPGPNVLAYYFTFRIVGHFFSIRGARQGLDRTRWQRHASPELRELRGILVAHRPDRHDRLHDVATRLRLEHLVSFVERITGR